MKSGNRLLALTARLLVLPLMPPALASAAPSATPPPALEPLGSAVIVAPQTPGDPVTVRRPAATDGFVARPHVRLAPGHTYQVTASIRLQGASFDQPYLRLLSDAATGTDAPILTRWDLRSEAGPDVTATFEIPTGTPNPRLALAWGYTNADLVISSFTVAPALQVRTTATPDGAAITVDCGPDARGQVSLRVTPSAGGSPVSTSATLGTPASLTLRPGLYQAVATSTDHGTASRFLFVGDVADLARERSARLASMLVRADASPFRGWLRFLDYEARTAATRSGATSETALAKAFRLDEWIRRLTDDPRLLSSLRGVHEWAYEARADGSGQPFRLRIPDDYDPARPTPLQVNLHGHSGNHLEHSTGMAPGNGHFEVAVLGRARGGGFRGLGESDILEVVDFISAHWAIDPDRVHITGGSMGGQGSFRLAARFPDRWASATPSCGFALQYPPGNWLTVPFYGLHSDDDWVVSVLMARAPLQRLRELGGQAFLDETTGLGHAVWLYREGIARAADWRSRQVRPSSRDVRRIDFTATDGIARKAWWAEIEEWGPADGPARFAFAFGRDGSVTGTLHNTRRVRLDLDRSPAPRSEPLAISINGARPLTLPAPLPSRVWLVDDGSTVSLSTLPDAPPSPCRTPGGPENLFDGRPIAIVYGTRGDEATRAAMKAAADNASRSQQAAWPFPGSDGVAPDGLPHDHMTYATLPVYADTEVTPALLASSHLVVIGNPLQNAVAAQMAPALPVRWDEGTILLSDGERHDSAGRMLGLVHPNPFSHPHLVYWVAGNDAAAYRIGTPLPTMFAFGPHDADLIITDAADFTLVATRRFTTRWSWKPRPASDPLLPADISTHAAFSRWLASQQRAETGADFALTSPIVPNPASAAVVPGITRLSDVTRIIDFSAMTELRVSRAELLAADAAFRAAASPTSWIAFEPAIDPGALRDDVTYRVVLPGGLVWGWSRIVNTAPRDFRLLDLSLPELLARRALR